MQTHLKILGLSLLALTALMVTSASTVHAKWLVLRNKTSVNLLDLKVTLNAGEFLVPGLGIEIYCSGGAGTVHLERSSNGQQLLAGTAKITFHECVDLNFGEVCTVHTLGQPDGLIAAQASGEASMNGPKVLLKLSNNEISNIVYLGAECPLHEVTLADDRVDGSVTFELLNPLADSNLHEIDLVEQNLLYLGEPANLHAGGGGILKGSVTEATGASFAVHLVDL